MKLNTNVCIILLQYVLNRTKSGGAWITDFETIAKELGISESIVGYHLTMLTKGCFTMDKNTNNKVTLYGNTELAQLLLDALVFKYQRLEADNAVLNDIDYTV